ncbi:MAG: TetR/AcrR family transcriptional regulator [Caulobacter sp.]|nr:TetR/AcrR family transcriptional regulator [Caulobacter sp.]
MLADRKLIAAARELFYRRGFQAVSVDEIAAEAGVTKMTLYRHFASKDALAAACLKEIAVEDLARFDAIAERLPSDPVGQLRAIVQEAAERIGASDYRGWSMTNVAVELTEACHPARQVAETYKTRTREHLLALAAQAGADRPRALADGLLLLIEGAAVSRQTFAAAGPSECLVDAFESLLGAQVLAKPQPA